MNPNTAATANVNSSAALSKSDPIHYMYYLSFYRAGEKATRKQRLAVRRARMRTQPDGVKVTIK
jgi:hypothetical protein